jgi:hypothetical protein
MLLLNKLRIGQVSDIEIAKLAALGNLAFIGCGILLAGSYVINLCRSMDRKANH